MGVMKLDGLNNDNYCENTREKRGHLCNIITNWADQNYFMQ